MILLRSNLPDERSLFGHTLRRGLAAVSTNGVVVEAYGYDPLGRRAYTATATSSGTVTNGHAYVGLHCVADLDADGTVLRGSGEVGSALD